MKKKYVSLLVILSMLVLCAGCNRTVSEQTPTPTSAPTAEPAMQPEVTESVTPTAPIATSMPTETPVPTEQPMNTPTPAPVEIEAPFAMVSPVPQSEVVDIVGTMTVDTYPVVDGSTATLPLSEAVFMAATGESAEVAAKEVIHTKTTNSYKRLYDGEVELLIVYEPAETIVERMKTEPLCIKPIGLDALVFLANTANPLGSLTMEQLVDIYSGKINNWSEVGGLDKELLAFQRPVGSGSQTLMQKLVMGDAEMVSGDNVYRYSTMSDILEGMLSYNNEDNTLGYSVFYYANNMYFEKDLKLMGVDGVIPSTRTIYDGSYQLTNAFYAVIRTDEPADSNARKIFDWLTGEAGQQMVLDLGYVPMQMPVGADISDAKAVQREKVEVLAKEPLEEGQYFIFMNSQNMVSEYYYGDMTVYNYKWEEVANFYNVSLNYASQGIYTSRYLPVGQIRQSAAGEQIDQYGIYDLEKGEYSIVPSYKAMSVLDIDRGYFAVPPEDDNWRNWSIIDGTGEVLLEKVSMEDWLTIYPFGNGYMEMSYDYVNWENGCTYRFYDENLKLTYVYCETAAAIPDDAECLAEVQYILMDAGGCLIDADGNVVFNTGIFLDKYGDGENFNCEINLYGPTLVEDGKIYAVKYCNQIFLLDSNIDAIQPIFEESIVNAFDSANFFENFCYYYDENKCEWVYCTYDGEILRDSYGMIPDGIEINWSNNAYVMYRKFGDELFVEEYTAEGDLIKYSIPLKADLQDYVFYYTEDGYVVLNENCGDTMQDPYYVEEMLTPQYIVSLLYQGGLIDVKHGMSSSYVYGLDENHQIWSVQNGNRLTAPSESVFEDFEYGYPLSDIVILEGQRIVYEIENAYLLFQENGVASFLSGNYLYVVGYDGTEYIKALHTFLNND